MTTTRNYTNQKSTHQGANNKTTTGTELWSWSRQQNLTIIASSAILGLVLAATACSKQSPKPALVGVSSPASTLATTAPPTAPTPTAAALPAPAKKTAKNRPANVTYSDASSGVSFLYPRKFALTSGDKAMPALSGSEDVAMNFVQPGGVSVARVALPKDLYRGTDLASAFFTVNVNRSVSEPECGHFAFVDSRDADGEPVDAEKVKVGPTEMEMTSNFSASAMKQVETQYYHSFDNGACYEYILGLGTEGSTTKGSMEHVNRDEVFAKLEKILATVKISPTRPEQGAEPGAASMASGKE
jgi:hypothetical protein